MLSLRCSWHFTKDSGMFSIFASVNRGSCQRCQTHFEFSFRYGWHICSCYGRNINQLPSSYSTCSLDGIHKPDVFFEERWYCHKFLSLVINLCENDNNQKHMPRYGGQRRMLSLPIILSRLYSMTNSISVMSPVP